MTARLVEWFWGRLPERTARVSPGLGLVLRDGAYLEAVPPVAALAPLAALVVGLLFGWFHPLEGALYTSSLLFLVIAVLVGTLSASVGAWLVLGYAVGDLFLAARDAAFSGSLASNATTRVALILCDVVLVILVVLVPLTARLLAGEVAVRWLPRGGRLAHAAVTAAAQVVIVYAWVQASLVLTRPYFTWHGQAPSRAAIDTLLTAAWALPLVSLGAVAARAWLEQKYGSRIQPRRELPVRERRYKLPLPVSLFLRVALAVFLLAGLFDSWIDAVVVAVVMGAFLLLREPALRRLNFGRDYLLKVPVLIRLIAGGVVSALIAIILVSAVGTNSVIRPVVISVLISLVVFTILLPDHLLEEAELEAERETASEAPPPPALPAPPNASSAPAGTA